MTIEIENSKNKIIDDSSLLIYNFALLDMVHWTTRQAWILLEILV